MKKGFGLLEVLVAAIVLGFLIVGLNRLQLGNREAILRIRARDAANLIAQHVLDSLGAVGMNSLPETNPIIDDTDEGRDYDFKGENDNVKSSMKFYVKVEYPSSNSSGSSSSGNANNFIDADIEEYTDLWSDSSKFAKNIQATVSWDFKGSKQSIKMSKVVR